jgi:hypothetical protein
MTARRFVLLPAILVAACERPADDAVPRWKLQPDPTIEIGSRDGETPYILYRVAGVVRLRGDRIAVANAGSSDIGIYDASGAHILSFGGQGRGPGEFHRIWAIGLYRGDSLWVADQFGLTLSIFDDAGRFGRRYRLDAPALPTDAIYGGDLSHVLGTLDDGSVIMETPYALPIDAGPGDHWFSTQLLRLDTSGNQVAAVGSFPARPVRVHSPGPRGEQTTPMFPSHITTAVVDSGVLIGGGPDHTIRFVDVSGQTTSLFEPPPGPLVEAEHVEWLERERAGEPRVHPPRRRPVPDRFPPYSRIVSGADGLLWLQGYAVPGASEIECLIVEPRRGLVARVAIPPRFRVYVFERERVLGIWRDEDDVEYIREYQLIRDP